MRKQSGSHNKLFLIGWIFLFTLLPAQAVDPPDSTINPVTGEIEIADAALQGGDYNIRHTSDPDDGGPLVVTIVTDHAGDDLGARIVNTSGGDTYVVWWRDGVTDEVWVRKRTHATSSWADESRVSEPGTDSRKPEIAGDGTDVWVVFESDEGLGETGISFQSVKDDPDPVILLATTTFTGDIDIRMHLEPCHFWVTWVNDDCEVGWSEYDSTSETWSVADYESCDSDSVEDARSRIRTAVLGS